MGWVRVHFPGSPEGPGWAGRAAELLRAPPPAASSPAWLSHPEGLGCPRVAGGALYSKPVTLERRLSHRTLQDELKRDAV